MTDLLVFSLVHKFGGIVIMNSIPGSVSTDSDSLKTGLATNK